MPDRQKKYRWFRTWRGETGIDGKLYEDCFAYDGEKYAGRIRLELANLAKGDLALGLRSPEAVDATRAVRPPPWAARLGQGSPPEVSLLVLIRRPAKSMSDTASRLLPRLPFGGRRLANPDTDGVVFV